MAIKPNRTKPRLFSACDAARIAREVVRDRGETPEEVLACIAKGMGFTHISLSRPQSVQAGNARAAVIIAKGSLSIIKAGLDLLRRRWPGIFARLGRLIEALDVLEEIIDAIFNEPEQRRVEDVAKCKCKDQPKVEEQP